MSLSQKLGYSSGSPSRDPGGLDMVLCSDPSEKRVLNPMTVTTPVLIPSPEPCLPAVSQPVPVPTPEPAVPPRPVSFVSVGTRPIHKQTPIPPDVWIPVSDRDSVRLSQVTYPTTLPPQPRSQTSASPTPSPIKSPRSQPILIVPPPVSYTHNSDIDSMVGGTSCSPVMHHHESHPRMKDPRQL